MQPLPPLIAILIHLFCHFGSELEFLHFWTIHFIGWLVIWLTSRARQLLGQMGRFGQQMWKMTYSNSDCGPRSRVNATSLNYIAGQTHTFNRHR